VASQIFERFSWWYALIPLGVGVLLPIFRAIAVVIVARCVNPEIAKLAIPLVLRPLRPSLKFWNTKGEDR
jgi:hypothetical protein